MIFDVIRYQYNNENLVYLSVLFVREESIRCVGGFLIEIETQISKLFFMSEIGEFPNSNLERKSCQYY